MRELVVMPLVGALIGWVTNWLAVVMLFRPRAPLRLPLLPWTLHGLLPRRQADLARAIGEIVEKELLPPEHLLERWESLGLQQDVTQAAVSHVSRRIDEKLARFLPPPARSALLAVVEEIVARETTHLMTALVKRLQGRFQKDIGLAALVEERILTLDLDQLEALVLRIARTELRHIELLGGVLGGLIGLIQALLLLAWGTSGGRP